MEWTAVNEACHGEIFNITNGDVFRWSQVFPSVAAAFGFDCVEPQTFRLADAMRGKESLPTIVHPFNGLPSRRCIPRLSLRCGVFRPTPE
jgi:hypothetical protein